MCVRCLALDHTQLPRLLDMDRAPSLLAGKVMDRYLRKAERMKVPQGKTAELGVGLLLAAALDLHLDDQLVEGEHGKPHVADGSCHIGISHDGSYVVLGICQEVLGIDVLRVPQELRDNSIPTLLRGYRVVGVEPRLPEEPTPRDFAHAWTRLEAVLKAEGKGFSLSPEGRCYFWNEWRCVWDDLPGHMLCAATKNGLPVRTTVVDAADLLARI